MTNIYIGSNYTHSQSDVCGYSIMIIRKIEDKGVYADIIYGVATDPEYTGLDELGCDIYALVRGLKFIHAASFDSYVSRELFIYYGTEKLVRYLNPRLNPRIPILKYFKKTLNFYSGLMNINFYYVADRYYNPLLNVADGYAEVAIKEYLELGGYVNIRRDIFIPHSFRIN